MCSIVGILYSEAETQNPTNLSVNHLRADREETEGIEGSYKFNYIVQEIAHFISIRYIVMLRFKEPRNIILGLTDTS